MTQGYAAILLATLVRAIKSKDYETARYFVDDERIADGRGSETYLTGDEEALGRTEEGAEVSRANILLLMQVDSNVGPYLFWFGTLGRDTTLSAVTQVTYTWLQVFVPYGLLPEKLFCRLAGTIARVRGRLLALPPASTLTTQHGLDELPN